jgi:phosphonopyruvate decarboxylase
MDALQVLTDLKEDMISVSTMRAIPDWYDTGGANTLNLDNRGCMGAAASFGLGLALSQPQRRIMVLDGDGSLLMQLGGLVSIAGIAPPNFYHFVLVNGVYETSGAQPIPNVDTLDFRAIAMGAGYRQTYAFDDLAAMRERLPAIFQEQGPLLITLKIEPDEVQKPIPGGRPDPAGYLRSQLVG